MKIFWFDSETTGVKYKDHQMLTFAAVVTDSSLNILDEIYIKIKLLPNIYPTKEALNINKLDPYTLFWEAEAVSESDFCSLLNDFYLKNKSENTVWIAYNSIFDTNFVRNAYLRSKKEFLGIKDVVYDPLVMCRKAVSLSKIVTKEKYNERDKVHFRSSTLPDVSVALETTHEGEAHNALVDTKCLIKTTPKAYEALVGHKDFSKFFKETDYIKSFLEKK